MSLDLTPAEPGEKLSTLTPREDGSISLESVHSDEESSSEDFVGQTPLDSTAEVGSLLDEMHNQPLSSSDSEGSVEDEVLDIAPIPSFDKPKKKRDHKLTLDKAWEDPEKENFKLWTQEAAQKSQALEEAWEKSEDESSSSVKPDVKVEYSSLINKDELKEIGQNMKAEMQDFQREKEAIEKLVQEKLDKDRKRSLLNMIEELIIKHKKMKKELVELKFKITNTPVEEEEEEEESDYGIRELQEQAKQNKTKFANDEDVHVELAKLQKLLEESNRSKIELAQSFSNEIDRMRNTIRQLTEQRPAALVYSGVVKAGQNSYQYCLRKYQTLKEQYL